MVGDMWERSRFFFHTGEIDGDGSLAAAQKKFLAKGHKNIKLELSETDEDKLPNAEEFERGIQFLKSGARFERLNSPSGIVVQARKIPSILIVGAMLHGFEVKSSY